MRKAGMHVVKNNSPCMYKERLLNQEDAQSIDYNFFTNSYGN